MVTVPSIKLNTGLNMPQVGFGLWKVPNDICADVVYNAIKEGYRLFDGAFDYANEKECGKGVKRALDDGIVKREELFITSKLWNSFHDKERVEPIMRKQLEWWGIDYFDLFLIHFPVALEYVDPEKKYPTEWTYYDNKTVKQSKATIRETWEAMEDVYSKGLAKNIGISNFQGSLIMDLLRYAKVRPAALQIEHHPHLVQPNLIKLAQREGIAITAYSSFGPQSFIELGFDKAADVPTLFTHPTVSGIAKKHAKTPAQVLLRWATQRGLAVIPKSINHERMLQNLDVCSFDLDAAELEAISGLDRNLRFNDPMDYLDDLAIFA